MNIIQKWWFMICIDLSDRLSDIGGHWINICGLAVQALMKVLQLFSPMAVPGNGSMFQTIFNTPCLGSILIHYFVEDIWEDQISVHDSFTSHILATLLLNFDPQLFWGGLHGYRPVVHRQPRDEVDGHVLRVSSRKMQWGSSKSQHGFIWKLKIVYISLIWMDCHHFFIDAILRNSDSTFLKQPTSFMDLGGNKKNPANKNLTFQNSQTSKSSPKVQKSKTQSWDSSDKHTLPRLGRGDQKQQGRRWKGDLSSPEKKGWLRFCPKIERYPLVN